MDTFTKYIRCSIIIAIFTLTCTISLIYIYKTNIKLQYSRIFPLGFVHDIVILESNSSKKNTLSNNNKKNILLVGDSRSQLWPKGRLSSKFNIINIAHGGQTSSQTLFQLKTQTIPKTKYAILQVGINDLHSIGTMPPAQQSLIVSQCISNIEEITKILTSKGHIVFLLTIIPPASVPLYRWVFWPENIFNMIDTINSNISKLETDNIFIVDSHNALKDKNNTGNIDSIYEDSDFFLHINEEAYKVVSSLIFEKSF
jgi:lysophospholipase L1-like esterase